MQQEQPQSVEVNLLETYTQQQIDIATMKHEVSRLVEQQKALHNSDAEIRRTINAIKYTLYGAIAYALLNELGIIGLAKLLG